MRRWIVDRERLINDTGAPRSCSSSSAPRRGPTGSATQVARDAQASSSPVRISIRREHLKDWPLERAPFLLEASVPGVFAAGDVRHESVKRVASAVGEGSVAVISSIATSRRSSGTGATVSAAVASTRRLLAASVAASAVLASLSSSSCRGGDCLSLSFRARPGADRRLPAGGGRDRPACALDWSPTRRSSTRRRRSGVILLLFTIGIEFSLEKLARSRRSSSAAAGSGGAGQRSRRWRCCCRSASTGGPASSPGFSSRSRRPRSC